ncbi:AMP-binding protein, partial [Streptomyces sp. TRM76130]|nr:AMP-binding protein [Streptomyces sp. TRM76130]
DSDPALVVCSARSRDAVPAEFAGRTLVVDDAAVVAAVADRPAGAVEDTERLTTLEPDHTAYVIYTSGSTGRP